MTLLSRMLCLGRCIVVYEHRILLLTFVNSPESKLTTWWRHEQRTVPSEGSVMLSNRPLAHSEQSNDLLLFPLHLTGGRHCVPVKVWEDGASYSAGPFWLFGWISPSLPLAGHLCSLLIFLKISVLGSISLFLYFLEREPKQLDLWKASLLYFYLE